MSGAKKRDGGAAGRCKRQAHLALAPTPRGANSHRLNTALLHPLQCSGVAGWGKGAPRAAGERGIKLAVGSGARAAPAPRLAQQTGEVPALQWMPCLAASNALQPARGGSRGAAALAAHCRSSRVGSPALEHVSDLDVSPAP